MSRHPTRRLKRYASRPIASLGAIGYIADLHAAMDDKLPIDPHAMTDLGIAYWVAFAAMVRGESREEDWAMVALSLNVTLILCERGFGKEYEPYIVAALEGAIRSKLRAKQLHVWRYDGNAICAIREALEVHDEQVKLASKADLREALTEVHARVAQGNVYREAA